MTRTLWYLNILQECKETSVFLPPHAYSGGGKKQKLSLHSHNIKLLFATITLQNNFMDVNLLILWRNQDLKRGLRGKVVGYDFIRCSTSSLVSKVAA